MPAPRPLCLYHRNCLDGAGAAAVVARAFPEAEFLPVQYGAAPPASIEGRKVFVVDFGFPLEAMRALRAQAAELVWIDHHASQEPVYRALKIGVFDVGDCATALAWRTLFPGQPEPPVIAYIRDKDLWQWRLADSRAIAAALDARFGAAHSKFKGLLEVDLKAMAELGRPLVAQRTARLAEAARQGRPVADALGVAGLSALAVPATKDLNELGEYITGLVADGGLGFGLAILYYRKADGTWVHSLRSRGDVDCAALAALRGGGGHPSAGCFLATAPEVPVGALVPPRSPEESQAGRGG